jgi:hypothetical protein
MISVVSTRIARGGSRIRKPNWPEYALRFKISDAAWPCYQRVPTGLGVKLYSRVAAIGTEPPSFGFVTMQLRNVDIICLVAAFPLALILLAIAYAPFLFGWL